MMEKRIWGRNVDYCKQDNKFIDIHGSYENVNLRYLLAFENAKDSFNTVLL